MVKKISFLLYNILSDHENKIPFEMIIQRGEEFIFEIYTKTLDIQQDLALCFDHLLS